MHISMSHYEICEFDFQSIHGLSEIGSYKKMP